MNDPRGNIYSFGPFRLDAGRRTLWRGGMILPLSPKEYETLLVLVESRGEVVGKEAIVSRVWPDTFVGDSSLTRNISMLRKALGDGVIETFPKFGYRLGLQVEVLGMEAGRGAQDARANTGAPRFPAWSARRAVQRFRRGQGILAALAVAIALGFGAYVHSRESQGPLPRPVRIAVLPFNNLTGDGGQEYLCDGLTDSMIAELSRQSPGHVIVIDRTSVMRYKAATKSAPEIGRELNVRYIVESSVRRKGNRLRVSAQLVRASDARLIWSGEFERKLKDVLNVQQEMATAIARQINLSLANCT